ncbi:putative Zinc finger, RanBP2-type [Plasmopara halstedii]
MRRCRGRSRSDQATGHHRSRSSIRRNKRRSNSSCRSSIERRSDRRHSYSSASDSGSIKGHYKKRRTQPKQKKKKKVKKCLDESKDNGQKVSEAGISVQMTSFEENSENMKVVSPLKPSVDARSFFEQLEKQEAAKKPVGTAHSRGLPAPVSATAISLSDKWECSKAGCGHMNFKHAPACNKCNAMKRLSEWR